MTLAHVSDESLVDVARGAGGARERAHVEACEACARRVAGLRETLDALERADVPEPSPFYWESLRRGVRQRIALERARRAYAPLLVPLAAAAALVAVLLMLPSSRPRVAAPVGLAAWSALPSAEDDESLGVLEGVSLASGALVELDDARGLDEYLAGLSDADSRALADTLRSAGKGGES
jgi:hypothetical protein